MTEQKTKYDFMPYWGNGEKCFEDAKVEGKDTRTGKKVSGFWPRDTPQAKVQYQQWLQWPSRVWSEHKTKARVILQLLIKWE